MNLDTSKIPGFVQINIFGWVSLDESPYTRPMTEEEMDACYDYFRKNGFIEEPINQTSEYPEQVNFRGGRNMSVTLFDDRRKTKASELVRLDTADDAKEQG